MEYLIKLRNNRILKELILLPNLLSVFRILLSPAILLQVIFPNSISTTIFVLLIFIVASISDFLDGYLARKFNQVSDTGKVLDPIADKLMIGFSLYAFAMLHLIYWWIAIVIIFREFFITVHRFYLLSKREVVGAEKAGKIKLVAQVVMIITTLLWLILDKSDKWHLTILTTFLHRISVASIWITLILTIYSGIDYFVNIYLRKDITRFKVFPLVSTLFGIGRISIMPGTLGSIVSLIVLFLINQFSTYHIYLLPAIIVSTFFIGVYSSGLAEKKFGHDASIIIIDEFVGQFIPFLFIVKIEVWHYIAAFVLFRFFDILKPLGINKSQKLPNGWGVLTDDLIAGIYSFIILHSVILIKTMYF
jgi:CDP-diacylglycerol---glycerol-3-phosphate 3-phosphatidyltransferase